MALRIPDPIARPLDHLPLSGAAHAEALRVQGKIFSYGDVEDAVGRIAAVLADLAGGRGARVAAWLPKTALACLMPLAAARAGLVYVPVNPLLRPHQLAHILADSGCFLLVTDPPRQALLDEAGGARPCALWLEGDIWDKAGRGKGLPPSAHDPDDLCQLLYTSGSTGMPKGVMLSHANLWLGAESVSAYLDLGPADRCLAMLPLSFDYGQNQLLASWRSGARVVADDFLLAGHVLARLGREKITLLAGVPSLWHQLVAHAGEGRHFPPMMPGLRLTNSGGPLTARLVQALRQAFPTAQIVPMYGLSDQPDRDRGSRHGAPGGPFSPCPWRTRCQIGRSHYRPSCGGRGRGCGCSAAFSNLSARVHAASARQMAHGIAAYPQWQARPGSADGVIAVKPMGPIPPFFASRAGELRIGGYDVSALVRAAGATPLFVYDMSIVRARLEGLRRALPAEIGLSYAMKANPFGPLVKAMAPLVEGMDVASRAELTQAVGAGARAISLAGPGKRDEDLAAAIAAGATINLESEAELHRALAAGCRLGRRPQLAVRINPDFGLRGAGLLMGGGARPFGVDVDLVPQLVRDILASSADWAGFHLFAGSQSLDTRALIAMHKAAFGLCDRLAREVGAEPRQITLGSGFGVPYAAGDFEIDIKAIGRALAEALAARSAHLASSQIILELGRYLVAEAGVYLTRILDRKNSHGQVFLVVDGGMHHQLAAAGLLGAVVRRNYPIAIATRFGLPVQEAASIVGCLCTPLDRLADQVAVPRAEPGDLVALFLAGAYGATASPAAFLGHGPAHELLVDGAGQDHGLLRLVGRS